ncbi:MAG: hypothetical protein GXY83_05365 [Rhodopirellula sp.]|nr:hypothetical protein [Rhodopirellula sp.]
MVIEFGERFQPLESSKLHVLVDTRTMARFCECHVRASRLIPLSTIDVPLDPDEQADYRANREMLLDHAAFQKMLADAKARRAFSDIVCEYNTSFDAEHPLKVIGGQHRHEAIRQALEEGIDEYQGIKVYFKLDAEQRLDVQLISNTNIAVSTDLYDRMQETIAGPNLRKWCQEVGLLADKQDFADRRQRAAAITVRDARTFIMNYYSGTAVDPMKFDSTETLPSLSQSGGPDEAWEELKAKGPKLWDDPKLKQAGREFRLLAQAQRQAIQGKKQKGRPSVDFAEKAFNFAVLSAWAFVAGILQNNPVRLKRHFELKSQTGHDPLNAAALAKARHKTDPENYRGLGYRTDGRERGRMVEVFFLQTEKGEGLTKALIDLAIKKYHAKLAMLEVLRAQEKV